MASPAREEDCFMNLLSKYDDRDQICQSNVTK